MDATILVNKLKVVFEAITNDGVTVECVALSPAYPDFVSSSYILMVASPTLQAFSCGQKIRTITSKLFALLGSDELEMIDRVRVYDTKQSLIDDAENGIIGYNYCETILNKTLQVA